MEAPILAHPDAWDFSGTRHLLKSFCVNSEVRSGFFRRQERFKSTIQIIDRCKGCVVSSHT
ncbi:MAG: hypothetical protein P4K83_11705 [Terracidiphilus sp.]|nr:hypothetical protein [Terracidiphilus sp.]